MTYSREETTITQLQLLVPSQVEKVKKQNTNSNVKGTLLNILFDTPFETLDSQKGR